jgi:predicted patatin/cPLA2 family phospholipase
MSKLVDLLEDQKNHKDKNKVWGLVLPGGGMRAVYSAGALATFIEYGFQETFDHVIGSSAGAMNGAYFLTSQSDAVATYTKDISNKNFVDLTRRDKKVDVDYVIDVALKQIRPLKTSRLMETTSKLHVVLTDAKTGRQFLVSDHKKFKEIYEELRATAALPILYDRKISIDGKEYIDGGVSNLVPIDVAIKLGCTDIVIIMTQQINSFKFDALHKRLVNRLIKHLAKTQTLSVKKVLPTNEKRLKRNLKTIIHPPKTINLYVLQPSDEKYLISTASIKKDGVIELAKLGVIDTEEFLHTIVS